MKRNHLWITILLIAIIFAFASCSDDPAQLTDKLGKIGIGGQSKGIATVVSYSSEVENLYWYYKATKADDGYKTGETTNFVPVAVSDGSPSTPVTGLSGKTLKSAGFSYGLWDIEFRGYTTTTNITSGTNCEYKATVKNFLVSNAMNYATVEIKLGDHPTTEIVFGNIWFSAENIKPTSNFTLSVTDNKGTVTVTTSSNAVLVGNGIVTFTNLTYAVKNGEVITGEHTMSFTLSQKLSGEGNTTINAAVYNLKFEVKPGTKTTISGDMIKSDQTGAIQINGVQSVPKTVLSKVIPVNPDTASTTSATVIQETTIKVGDLEVTYPVHAIIRPGDGGLSTDKKTSDGKVGFEYKSAEEPADLTITTEALNSAKYELTLSTATTEDNQQLITVKKNIGKGLEIIDIYHETKKLDKNETGEDYEGNEEYYEYNKDTGYLTLHIFHASSFYVVSKQAVAMIGETFYYSLPEAFTSATSGKTITVINNVTLDNSIVVDKDITLDLNGKTVSAVATGWKGGSPTKEALFYVKSGATFTINDSVGTGRIDANNNADIYGAVALTIKDNNEEDKIAKLVVNGGTLKGYYFGVVTNGLRHNTEIVVNGGEFTSYDMSDGTSIYHPNKGELTINGGTFEGYDGLAIKGGTPVTINGGTFVATGTKTDPTKAAESGTNNVGSALYVEGNYGYVAKVVINGGTFTTSDTNAPAVRSEFNAEDEATIEIKGGTFSSDPSEYVANGYIATDTGSNWVVSVNYVSVIGTTKYSSLDQAFTSASNGDTIKLLSDIGSEDNWVEFTNQYLKVTGNKSITLDLNRKSFYGKSTDMGYTSLVYVENGSSLTITDSSSNKDGALIYWDSKDNKGGLTIENKGTLVLEAGTIENVTTGTSADIQGAVDIHNNQWGTVYQQQNITFTMKGGKLKSYNNNTLRIYDSSENTGTGQFTISIEGGSIEGKDAVFIMPSNWKNNTIRTKFIVNISGGSFNTMNGIRVFTGFTSDPTPYTTEQPIQITVTGGTFKSSVFNSAITNGQKVHSGVIIQDGFGSGNNNSLAGYVTVTAGSENYLHPTN